MAKALALQTFVYLARSADPAVKPAFVSVGDIDEVEVTHRPNYKLHSGPTVRGRRRKYVVPIGAELDFSFTLTELSGWTWEQIFGTDPLNLTGNQQYNPLEVGQPWQGFVKFQQYDGSGTLKNTVDIYAALTPNSVRMGADEVQVSIKGEALESTLNTGSLTDLV